MPQLAPHVRTQPASGIRLITEQAWRTPDAIVLSVGEPEFEVAAHVREAAIEAWRRDDTNYEANSGIPALRQAIADDYASRIGVSIDPKQVVVTSGAVQGMHLAMSLVLGVGDEILVPNPGYTIFRMAPHLLQAVPVEYSLRPETGFLPDTDELEQLVTPRTRALLINSPSNPLGSVIPGELIEQLYAFAQRHDLWIISDECYQAFSYGEPHVSPMRFDVDHRVLAAYSFSKTYGMTGVRVGYLIVPPGIGATVDAVQESIVSCINTPAQYAAVAALTGPQDYVEHALAFYAEAAAEASAALTARGFHFLSPRGAFYLWVDVSHVSGGNVEAWALEFLRDQHVAVAPGSAFGTAGEGWVRISLAGDRARLLEGLSRLPAPAPGFATT